MTLNGKLADETFFNSDFVVLVADTNFFTMYSNNHLWPRYTHLKTMVIAREKERKFFWVTTSEIQAEYERHLARGTTDFHGNLLAQGPMDQHMPRTHDFEFSNDDDAKDLAIHLWTESNKEIHDPKSSKIQKGPPESDLSLLVHAIQIAKQGAEVYMASYDFRDIIKPLKSGLDALAEHNLIITPESPSEIELQYLTPYELSVEFVVTNEVMGYIDSAEASGDSHPVAIIEKGVKSGDAIFDAVVNIGYKEYLHSPELPTKCNIKKYCKRVGVERSR